MTALFARWVSATGFRLAVVGLVLVVIACMGWQVHRWRSKAGHYDAARAELASERACLPGTACAAMVAGLQAEGVAAVEAARKAAQEAAQAEQARLAAEAGQEAERLAAAAAEAGVKANRWRQRYEAALRTPACSTWSAREVPCPVE